MESIEALAARLGIDRETEAVDYAVLAGIPADEYV
jgi:hypothetical protein